MRFPLIPAAMVLAALASPAAAKVQTYTATLGGIAPPTVTNSPASGKAVIRVDTKAKTVSIELDVSGIALDGLADALVAGPTGPVLLHEYRGADDVERVLPLPYPGNYRAAKGGFHASLRNYDFAAGTKLVGSGESFDEFVHALDAGRIVVQVHSDKFPDGEISGRARPK